ncbi:MAG: ribosome biogenesis GTP-binding protein YihA/YsxC [Bacillota bacterium]|nr:ribosome biogenesis GTP-binding protein YihA/YsxC [Bacillota bacterium]
MKINNPSLEKIAVKKSQYPQANLPEIALAGRSNVGKSSFINTLINRKKLARTSSQPGKTRTINFYNIDDKFRLVDLPGYGYAKVSKAERDKWAGYINDYLDQRENLLDVFLIIDFRHGPSELDLVMYDYILESGFSGIVIASKFDKVKKSQQEKNLKMIYEKLQLKDKSLLIPFSAESKHNKDLVLNKIEEILKA